MSLLEEVKFDLDADSTDFLYRKDLTIIEDEIINEGRWDLTHRTVLTDGKDFVAAEYTVGATEYQDDTELNGEVYAVYPKQIVKTIYVKSGVQLR